MDFASILEKLNSGSPESVLVAWTVVVLAYFVVVWLLVGIDPRRGTSGVVTAPPMNLSPACLRYIRFLGYDSRCFSTAVISMAQKGFLSITERKGKLVLHRISDDREMLSMEEKKIAETWLTGEWKREFTIEQERYLDVIEAPDLVYQWLSGSIEGFMHQSNNKWFFPGAMMALVGGVLSVAQYEPTLIAVTIGVLVAVLVAWAVLWASVGLSMIFDFRAGVIWRGVARIFAIGLLGVVGMSIGYLMVKQTSSWQFVGNVTIMTAICVGFRYLLKRSTKVGRRIMADIESYQNYLMGRSADLSQLSARECMDLLPYAVGLDTVYEWAEATEAKAREENLSTAELLPWWGLDSNEKNLASLVNAIASDIISAVQVSSTGPTKPGSYNHAIMQR